MAAKNPRISVMLEPEVYRLYQDFAAAQGRSMSSVIGEMLKEVSPPIARTLSLLNAAQKAPKQVLQEMADNFDSASEEVRSMLGGVNELQLDLLLQELQRKAAEPPSCNTGVTTHTPTSKNPKPRTKRG
jgi:hypothetical protein